MTRGKGKAGGQVQGHVRGKGAAAGGGGILLVALAALAALAAPAAAQPDPGAGAGSASANDIEVPVLVTLPGDTGEAQGRDEALDLANIVQSAAKGVTTVQEAPAIVTVITDQDIRERQFHSLDELIDSVPGWSRVAIYHSTFDTPLVRGQVQAVQFLHDGLSLFDPFINVPAIGRTQPMELIKRVEMITGPGGVLWGSNSLLGILNVITKDADDVDGVEVGGDLGDGPGDRLAAHAYVMAGKTDLLGGRLKLFGHASVDTYQGAALEMPILLFHDPLPQPNSPNSYGPLATSDQAQSLVVTLDGKATMGKLQIRFYAPFGSMYKPMGLSGEPVRDVANPLDPTGAAQLNRSDVYDRYLVAEYRTRFAHDRAGITARAYAQQFVRTLDPLQVLAPSPQLVGGLAFDADFTSYRAGGSIDGDAELARGLRLLYGGEAFREWEPGSDTHFLSPQDLTRLPLLCPRTFDATTMTLAPEAGCPLVFAYPASRSVLGAYVDPQWRPNKQLIFDGGARLQIAPAALGTLSYPLNATLAGTVVWNFLPDWHAKLNYTQGFRPPVFNDTASNGEAVQIGGNPDLSVETSDAVQGEINARILHGERRIRELAFRVDGSYTRLNDLIQVTEGNYANSGARGIASVEFLGSLYVQGGHRIELGYTYLSVDTSDKGPLRALPENWFDLADVFDLIDGKLTATTDLRVTGAAEDPNRLVEYRGSSVDAMGNVVNPVTVAATDLVLDRIPPIAELSLGMTWTPTRRLSVRLDVYDALFGHYYQPDAFFDYEPHLEYLPNPYEGFRAYLSAFYHY